MKVLVVDDSALMRRALKDIIDEIRGVEVRTARNGQEGLELALDWKPDVMTLDVNMPVMDGLTCLSHVMTEAPCPVVMVSSITSKDSGPALEALSMGAIEVIEKPDGTVSRRINELAGHIRRVVSGAAGAKLRSKPRIKINRSTTRAPTNKSASSVSTTIRTKVATPKVAGPRSATPNLDPTKTIVLIGVSTGGPGALENIIPNLPAKFPAPIVIAQHMPGGFTQSFAARLDTHSKIKVVEASNILPLEAGTAYIIHGGSDGLLEKRLGRFVIHPVPMDKAYTWHPSVDRLVWSALEVVQPQHLLCVLLTGMGDDGAKSMAEAQRRGGYTLAEAESSSVVFGMPRELIARGGASEVLDLTSISPRLRSLLHTEEGAHAAKKRTDKINRGSR